MGLALSVTGYTVLILYVFTFGASGPLFELLPRLDNLEPGRHP